MAWGKNGTPSTLTSAGDIMTISDMTANKFNSMLTHEISAGNGTIDNQAVTYNANTNAVYSQRMSTDGSTDTTGINQSSHTYNTGNIAHDHFRIEYVCSIDGEEKLIMGWDIRQGSSTGVPSRYEGVGKFVPSPDVGITSVTDTNNGTGDFDISSNLSALGSDLTPAAASPSFSTLSNVQVGSRAEITDTRKMYHRDDVDFKEEKLSGDTP